MKRDALDHQEIVEARELLMFWYGRWQGAFDSHVPPDLHLRTKAFVERNGGEVPHPAFTLGKPPERM